VNWFWINVQLWALPKILGLSPAREKKKHFVAVRVLSSHGKGLAFNMSLIKSAVNIRLNFQIFDQNETRFILKKVLVG
jgi:hypothetical protein